MLIRLLQSRWTAVAVGVVMFLGTLLMALRPQFAPTVKADSGKRAPSGPSWTFQNPEVDLLIQELKKEKDGLAAREKDLNDLLTRLEKETQELQALTQAVAQVQAEFDASVLRVRQEEVTNLKKLAKTYAAMAPQNAAAVFRALDEDTLVKVLSQMRDAEVAAVFDVLAKQSDKEAKRVAALCERIRRTLSDAKKAGATS